MGMGEPFLNYERVMAAADLLRCPYGGAVGAQSITISTVGLVPRSIAIRQSTVAFGWRSAWERRPTPSEPSSFRWQPGHPWPK